MLMPLGRMRVAGAMALVSARSIKTLAFERPEQPVVSSCRLFEDIDGDQGPALETLLVELSAGAARYEPKLFLPVRVQARYCLEACGASGGVACVPCGLGSPGAGHDQSGRSRCVCAGPRRLTSNHRASWTSRSSACPWRCRAMVGHWLSEPSTTAQRPAFSETRPTARRNGPGPCSFAEISACFSDL